MVGLALVIRVPQFEKHYL